MRTRRDAATLAATLAALAAVALAPNVAGAQRGVVSGVVHDSLGRRPLAGAVVQGVRAGDSTGARAVAADAAGRFRLDSLAPGRYLVGFSHPLLDLLRVEAAPRLVDVAAGDTVRVDLAVPELARVRQVVCGSAQAPDDSAGLLAGRVRDATDGAPVANAAVILTWSETVLGERGLRTEERRLPVLTGPGGVYVVCGVPAGEPLVATAAAPGRSSGEVALQLPPRGLVVRDLALGDSTARGTARVAGTVRDSAGRPVSGARAAVRGTDVETVAGEDGAFVLGGLPAGTHTLEVRAIGFGLREIPVDLAAGRTAAVALRMDRTPTLAPVTVLGTPSSRLAEFLDRMRNNRAGEFVTAEDIARRDAFEVADALRGVRRVEVRRNGPFAKRVLVHGSFGPCAPTVMLDGMSLPLGDNIDRWVGPKQVIGVEIYPDAVSVPIQYRQNPPRIDGCGTLLIWTRR